MPRSWKWSASDRGRPPPTSSPSSPPRRTKKKVSIVGTTKMKKRVTVRRRRRPREYAVASSSDASSSSSDDDDEDRVHYEPPLEKYAVPRVSTAPAMVRRENGRLRNGTERILRGGRGTRTTARLSRIDLTRQMMASFSLDPIKKSAAAAPSSSESSTTNNKISPESKDRRRRRYRLRDVTTQRPSTSSRRTAGRFVRPTSSYASSRYGGDSTTVSESEDAPSFRLLSSAYSSHAVSAPRIPPPRSKKKKKKKKAIGTIANVGLESRPLSPSSRHRKKKLVRMFRPKSRHKPPQQCLFLRPGLRKQKVSSDATGGGSKRVVWLRGDTRQIDSNSSSDDDDDDEEEKKKKRLTLRKKKKKRKKKKSSAFSSSTVSSASKQRIEDEIFGRRHDDSNDDDDDDDDDDALSLRPTRKYSNVSIASSNGSRRGSKDTSSPPRSRRASPASSLDGAVFEEGLAHSSLDGDFLSLFARGGRSFEEGISEVSKRGEGVM